jgi:acyl-CoA synthetase (AMP-forming)/AMP-acid ligase II
VAEGTAERATTTPQLVDRAAALRGDAPFLVEQAGTVGFQGFRDRVRAVAASLIALGIEAGDRVAVWCPNRSEWVIAALGAQYAGATLVTLNTRFKGAEAARTLDDSGARVLFCIGCFLDTDYPASLDRGALPSLEHVVVFGDSAAEVTPWEAFLALGEAVGDRAVDARRDAVTADTPSDIIFTSGTTGRAKGVVTAHGQNLQAFGIFAELLGLEADDRYLVINPFFHSFGYKAGILACLSAGCALYPMAVFDPASVLETIERESISVLPGPPTLFQSLLADAALAERDISSLSKATTGAAVIPVSLIGRMRRDLGIDTVITAYGLSECCGLATMCRRGDDDETIATTSGCAIPGTGLRIASEAGAALPAGQAGEIQLRGFNLMRGYFNDPEATARTYTPDSWLRSGDIGVLDERGYLRITDRLKDMFICGGFNCYPAEIENTLNGHTAVQVAAVVGAPDQRLGEVAHAFVVRRPGTALSEEQLIAWSREQMANYKVPRAVTFVDALPLNAAGKVLKTELRRRLAPA